MTDSLRARMRTDLVTAMKARERDTVSALRTAIAALDNAEAVEVADDPHAASRATSEHVAGASVGVGAAETARRTLTADDVRGVLRAQIAERTTEADQYEALGQADAAARLRREADALRPYLS